MLQRLVCQGKHYSINLRSRYPFSIQAGDPKIIANECEIDVVSDFRNDHIKLGGEGAPLVPEFHQKLFAKRNTSSGHIKYWRDIKFYLLRWQE